MSKRMLAAFVAAATLFCAAAAAAGPQKTRRPKPPAQKPEAVVVTPKQIETPNVELTPALPKVTEIDEHALKSMLGAGAGRVRPLLVNFWATWCGPCREEFPDLVKIRGQYGEDRLDFALVSLDDPADIDKAVPEFLAEQRAAAIAAYLLHAADDGAAINLVDPTWSGELPATFLYDRSGQIVFKHKGRIKPDALRAALEEALKEKPQAAAAQK